VIQALYSPLDKTGYRAVKIFVLLSLFFLFSSIYAQKAVVHGTVTDANSNEKLIGVSVMMDSLTGVPTNNEGHYRLDLNPGQYRLQFRYIGYQSEQRVVDLITGDSIVLNIKLTPRQFELDMAVVTAGKYEQRLSDVTVSMEIIKAEFIENTNTINMETAISKIPGVDILDGQPSIRGGSGYSFGAGSRVMVLVDGLPVLTADVNEVKWNFLPVEIVERVEIMKGASSALYGSSALNGVVNMLTTWPDSKPSTTVSIFNGAYSDPKREELSHWWEKNPGFAGASFSTSRKIGNFDLVLGANAFNDPGYRQMDYEERIRVNFKLRHNPASVKGLSYGLNTNIQWQNTSDFLIWQDADSGAFLQRPDAITPTTGFRFNLDPWVSFYDDQKNRHSLRTRFLKVYNRFEEDPDKDNGSDMYYGEYQFQREIREKLNLTAGFTGLYGVTNANLYGDHYNSSIAVYSQFDYAFLNRLSASLGMRWEHYTLDRTDRESSPVMRAGLNYRAAPFTFLRASYGMGYRFPSIAEKYTSTNVGSLKIFPNPVLNSETGWSAEIGAKQGFKISEWSGFVDLAAFWTEYRNMIEFTFGVWNDPGQIPTLDDIGFKSLNVGKARINGIDFNISGTGKAGNLPLTLFTGYTFMNPIDLSTDTLQNNILKYRYKHSLKGHAEVTIKKVSPGITLIYNSFMERIDEAFEATILGQEIFPGLKDYRLTNNEGFVVLDISLAYQLSPRIRVAVLANNLFNKEYMGRPGDIRPPRNISVQIIVKV
jgi:outer membrane receptor protein involved in Fe transport